MKQRGYTVRTEGNWISVEHRAYPTSFTVLVLTFAYLIYCLIPPTRDAVVNFYTSHDPVVGGVALFMLLLPFLSTATWLRFASGEVMHCDARELRFARRRTLGLWRRFQFSTSKIRQLRRETRGTSKTRNYSVLAFEYEGKKYDLLEEISRKDSDRVLHACKTMGLDVFIPIDEGTAMLNDIEERGWFVNPWSPDHEDNPPPRK